MEELEEAAKMTVTWEVACYYSTVISVTLYPETDKERRMKHKNGKIKSVVTADILYEMR